MSIARVKTTKAAKTYECEKCRTEIEKGTEYLSYKVGFRSRFVHRRHPDCRPRTSELESSKLADVYSAQEDAQDALGMLDPGSVEIDDVQSIIDDLISRVEDVKSEYEDAATDDNGTEWNLDAAERRDTLENVISDLDGCVDERMKSCENCDGEGTVDGVECLDCEGEGEVLDGEAVIQSAIDAVDGMEF